MPHSRLNHDKIFGSIKCDSTMLLQSTQSINDLGLCYKHREAHGSYDMKGYGTCIWMLLCLASRWHFAPFYWAEKRCASLEPLELWRRVFKIPCYKDYIQPSSCHVLWVYLSQRTSRQPLHIVLTYFTTLYHCLNISIDLQVILSVSW
jgi:hypothetical protein